MTTRALNIFISYSHKDDIYRNDFETTLSLLKRQKIVNIWYDRKILPGQYFDDEISKNLENADIIVPLLSPDFINSDYCYDIEMIKAFQLHDEGKVIIVPIIVRPCSWKNSPFANFQVLPSEGKPISNWTNKDDAWLNIFDSLNNLCKSVHEKTATSFFLANYKGNSKRVIKKIGIFGETQSGKSTLCNAIIGIERMLVSDITPVTKIPQSEIIKFNNYDLMLIDCPGIGESLEEDERVEKIYDSLFSEVDMIVWVLRADVRNYSSDQKFIEKIKQIESYKKTYCIILNMIDRIMLENNGWDVEYNKPNKSLELLIERKIMYISGLFRIPSSKIIPTVGFLRYNIESVFKVISDLTK
jgi:predicted GTPase